MTSNFVSALKAEITELEAELRDDPRQRKLATLRAALAEYEPANKDLQAHPVTPLGASTIWPPTITLQTKGDKIKAEITAFLQQRGGRAVHRKEILSHLISIGLMGREKTPIASLAAYLTGWNDTFGPDGRGNWVLKEGLKAAE